LDGEGQTTSRATNVALADLLSGGVEHLLAFEPEQFSQFVDVLDAFMNEPDDELVEQRKLLAFLGEHIKPQHRHGKGSLDESQQFKAGALIAEATADLFRSSQGHRSAILISQSSWFVSIYVRTLRSAPVVPLMNPASPTIVRPNFARERATLMRRQ